MYNPRLTRHFLINNFKFSSEVISKITGKISLRVIHKGDLFKIPNNETFFVLDGKLKLLELEEAGNQQIKEFLFSGEIWPSNTMPDQEFTCHLESLADKTYLGIPDKDFFDFVLNDSVLAQEIKAIGKRRILKLNRRISCLMCKDIEKRLLLFLSDLAEELGTDDDEVTVFSNFLSHYDIAMALGVARQTVTTLLNKLRTEQQIRYDSKHIILMKNDLVGRQYPA